MVLAGKTHSYLRILPSNFLTLEQFIDWGIAEDFLLRAKTQLERSPERCSNWKLQSIDSSGNFHSFPSIGIGFYPILKIRHTSKVGFPYIFKACLPSTVSFIGSDGFYCQGNVTSAILMPLFLDLLAL